MVNMGFSVKATPEIMFESPDAHKKEEGEFWTSLVNAKIQTPQQACDHLDLEYDEEYWTKQVELEQQKFEQNLKAKQEQPFGKPAGEEKPQVQTSKEGKSFKVTELFEEHHHD